MDEVKEYLEEVKEYLEEGPESLDTVLHPAQSLRWQGVQPHLEDAGSRGGFC